MIVDLCAATVIVSMMALNPFYLYTDGSNANTDALLHQDTNGSNSSATISTNGVIKALLFQDSDANGNTTVDGVQHHRHTRGATVNTNITNTPSDNNLDRRHGFL